MAYTLCNMCAKNLCKQIVLLQLIIENVVTCFFLENFSYTSALDLPMHTSKFCSTTQSVLFGLPVDSYK